MMFNFLCWKSHGKYSIVVNIVVCDSIISFCSFIQPHKKGKSICMITNQYRRSMLFVMIKSRYSFMRLMSTSGRLCVLCYRKAVSM